MSQTQNNNQGMMDNLKKVSGIFCGANNQLSKSIVGVRKLKSRIINLKMFLLGKENEKSATKVFIPKSQDEIRGNNGPKKFSNNKQQLPPRNGTYNKTTKPQSYAEKILGKNDIKDNAKVLVTETREVGNKQKDNSRRHDEKSVKSKKTLIRMGYIELNDNEDRMGSKKVKVKKQKETSAVVAPSIDHAVIDTENLTVKILSEKIGKPVSELIKKFMLLGMMLNINSSIDFDSAELIASEFNITLEKKIEQNMEEKLLAEFEAQTIETADKYVKRAPVVTIMGHVDHGKTSLLDTIRKTNIVSGEAGGITQHIGAYTINWNGDNITFIDTPGHAAFTAMRARGAKVTDVAILVVAADDGIMPQTVEAIKHIKSANVPMIVAVNKIDKQGADSERIKRQLTEYEVIPEEWGGDAIIVEISAKQNINIDKLLETILLVAEMQELKANPNRKGKATVIEAKLDKGRGAVATLLVEDGTIKIGDSIVCGLCVAKVKALIDDKGKRVKSAGPSIPVEVLGFDEAPQAGDIAYVVDEKFAKQVASERKAKKQLQIKSQITPSDREAWINGTIATDTRKPYNIIIKGDVQGSVEALRETLEEISNEEIKIVCISSGVGSITENDITMAQASNSAVIAFNIKVDARIQNIAEKENIEIQKYDIIYSATEALQDKIDSLMTPKYNEVNIGTAEVRMMFKLSSVGLVAGSYVTSGKVQRNCKVRVVRNGSVIGESSVSTLKIQKNDVKEVGVGFECGIKLDNFDNLKEGDILECYILELIKRTRNGK